jgi:hypothetical protein
MHCTYLLLLTAVEKLASSRSKQACGGVCIYIHDEEMQALAGVG